MYTISLTLIDLICYVIALIITGVMLGHHFLPAKIDMEKEKLISNLFDENMKLKYKLCQLRVEELKQEEQVLRRVRKFDD